MQKHHKRTNRELQTLILKSLKLEQLTINEISDKTGIYWPNTRHQLILLKGEDYVKEVFRHRRFRLFAITDLGLKLIGNKNGEEKSDD